MLLRDTPTTMPHLAGEVGQDAVISSGMLPIVTCLPVEPSTNPTAVDEPQSANASDDAPLPLEGSSAADTAMTSASPPVQGSVTDFLAWINAEQPGPQKSASDVVHGSSRGKKRGRLGVYR